MTNQEIEKKWKTLTIRFTNSGEVQSMNEMFLICPGEMNIDVGGKQETVVVFYQGYDTKGSPAIFLSSDDSNNVYAYAFHCEKKIYIKALIGKFVKPKKIRVRKKK
jgi:hypothetical protein